MEVGYTGAEDRKQRLVAHLDCPEPELILVGNAAGYQETRFTGIPFTSEKVILDGLVPRVTLPSGTKRLSKLHEPLHEQMAEIVWKALHEHGIAHKTVLCNAVPWHPEGEKGSKSNRSPTAREIQLGRIYLHSLLDMYPNVPIAAVGAVAQTSLSDLGAHFNILKDPSVFGYQAFNESIEQLLL
jgi:uracil-DNA glycosylase